MTRSCALALAIVAVGIATGMDIQAAGAQGMMSPPGMSPSGMPAQGMSPQGMPAQGAPQGGLGAPSQCAKFPALNSATQEKANQVSAAMKAHAPREEICHLMTVFVAAEESVVKFLIENKTWCGVPDQAIAAAKTSHDKSTKFRDAACTAGPSPKAPTLSDAIKTTPVDSAGNTKTGRFGTFDSLTGNPLAK
jgi:hypothetical protein